MRSCRASRQKARWTGKRFLLATVPFSPSPITRWQHLQHQLGDLRHFRHNHRPAAATNATFQLGPVPGSALVPQRVFVWSCVTPASQGSAVLTSARTTTHFCPAGFRRDGNNDCALCDPGRYSNRSDAPVCSECPAGKNLVEPPQTSALAHDSEDDCTICPARTYNPLPGLGYPCTDCPSSLQSGATECAGCSPGQFKNATRDCEQCPNGYYTSKGDLPSCSRCPKGYHANPPTISIISAGDEGGGASSSSTNATIRDSCTACPRGMYGDAEAALIKAIACAPCAAGRYSELEGVATTAENTPVQEMCMACPRGRWSDTPGQDTEALCRLCGPGRYGSGSSTAGAASNTSCAPCPGGKFSVAVGSWGENKTCGACPVGFHQNVEGQAFCLPCLPGQFGNESGLRKCFECAAGQYRSAGDEDDDDTTASCDACPKGYYQGSAGRASCLPCLPGLFGNVSGLVECQACPSGKVSKDQNASVCADCDPGESSSATGSASCTACGAGQFSSISGGDCEECAEGRYRVQAKDPTKNDPTKCTACPTGYYQGSAGRASCLPCLPGTFSDTPGLISCMACKTGQFQSEVNATQCKDIKEGHISGPDRSSQIQIALGFRAINCANIKGNGTQTCADTQKCPEGTRGATPVATPQCVPCGQGKTSPGGVHDMRHLRQRKVWRDCRWSLCRVSGRPVPRHVRPIQMPALSDRVVSAQQRNPGLPSGPRPHP